MRKRFLAAALCVAMAAALAACGEGKNTGDNTESEAYTDTQAAKPVLTYDGERSAQMDIDLEKQITSMPDYMGIGLTITGDYEVTDQIIEDNVMQMLSYYGAGTVEVTDRDVVEEGDYVQIDYVGYKDGEAFEGGTASNIMMDVSNNTDVTNPMQINPYIEGFCDDLVGAKVGDVLKTDVTFPENYHEELAGQPAVFEITVKGIYQPVTPDMLDDDMVAATFSENGIKTKEELFKRMKEALENQAASAKSQAEISAAQSYILEHGEVEIPQEYFEARLAEYEYSAALDNCKDGQTLEEFFAENGTTIEEQRESWRTMLEQQIKMEFLFLRIADLEKIEIDEEDFSEFIDYMIQTEGSGFTDAEDVYEYYGVGNAEDGESALRRLYRANKAVSFVAENADITVNKN